MSVFSSDKFHNFKIAVFKYVIKNIVTPKAKLV